MTNLLGYCWVPDPTTCGACSQDETEWGFKRNDASHSSGDIPRNIIAGDAATSATATTYSTVVPAGGRFDLSLGNYNDPNQQTPPLPPPLGPAPDVINVPVSSLNGIPDHYVNLASDINYTATLSNEFTVADEIAGQLAYTSNGKTSENQPNILTWTTDYIVNIQSKTTSVNYVFSCSNLLAGESYTVRYELNDSDGTGASYATTFTAGATTHTILGSLPTPASGHTITLRNVRVAYAV
jgi:hypothetical protein